MVSTRICTCRQMIAQSFIAHHRAGQQPGFAENLETVADAENQAAGTRESIHRFHYRRKARNGAGAQIIAVGEPAGQDDDVAAGEIFGLVPDEFDGLVEDVGDGVVSVVVAIRAGKLRPHRISSGHAPSFDFSIGNSVARGHTMRRRMAATLAEA